MKVKFRRVTNLLSTIISVQIKRLLKLRGTYKTTTTTTIKEEKKK